MSHTVHTELTKICSTLQTLSKEFTSALVLLEGLLLRSESVRCGRSTVEEREALRFLRSHKPEMQMRQTYAEADRAA